MEAPELEGLGASKPADNAEGRPLQNVYRSGRATVDRIRNHGTGGASERTATGRRCHREACAGTRHGSTDQSPDCSAGKVLPREALLPGGHAEEIPATSCDCPHSATYDRPEGFESGLSELAEGPTTV